MEKDNYTNKGYKWHSPFVIGAGLATKPLFKSKKHILIPCMMKSGSTFLANILSEHENMRRVRLVPAWGVREQELSEQRLLRYNHNNYTAQHHIKNSEWTQTLIKRYNLKTIVQIRNLFDIVISLRDHIRNETHSIPVVHFTEEYKNFSDEALENAIVNLMMPWFVNFYAGWRLSPDIKIIRYEDMIIEPHKTAMDILEYVGIKTTPENVEKAVLNAGGKNNRLNKGVSGRGSELAPEMKQRIIDMLDCYPHIQEDLFVLDMKKQLSL